MKPTQYEGPYSSKHVAELQTIGWGTSLNPKLPDKGEAKRQFEEMAIQFTMAVAGVTREEARRRRQVYFQECIETELQQSLAEVAP